MTSTPRLSRTAPWNPRLGNSYRDRWTEVNGRRFKVYARDLRDVWTIEEVDEDGNPLVVKRPERPWQAAPDEWEFGYTDFAFTLAEARNKIAAETAP